jgi:chaperonin GroES
VLHNWNFVEKIKKRILPLFDRILVQRVKAAERTAAGLFIPEKAQETLNEGVVIAVGPGTVEKVVYFL